MKESNCSIALPSVVEVLNTRGPIFEPAAAQHKSRSAEQGFERSMGEGFLMKRG